jgi:hypothetical protein
LWRQPEMANELAAEVADIAEPHQRSDALHTSVRAMRERQWSSE